MIKVRTANWLSLAAAPVFAVMALKALLFPDGHAATFCSEAEWPSLLAGMGPMYLLMAIVHLPAWLRISAKSRADFDLIR